MSASVPQAYRFHGNEISLCCQNLESRDDGSVGLLPVLDADWSVVTKYRGR